MAYIYRHVRLDKNEPFYIGIGNDNKEKYTRAYINYGRNNIWKNITSKTPYKVDILLDNLSWEEACDKEKEFIKLYGRIDSKTGILSNMTNGGEGTIGYKRNKKLNNDALWYRAINIYQYDLEGNFIKEWKSTADACKELNLDRGHVCNILKGKKHMVKDYMFRYEKYDKIKQCQSHKYKPIFQYDLEDNFIKEWKSTKEAEVALNKIGIYSVLTGKTKTCAGYKWHRNKI
jgi:hypothetical protein